jgi:Fe-S cluster assembly ATP-binding protein
MGGIIMNGNANILEIKNLYVEVGGKKLIENLNLVIGKGEVHALLGVNGSGKTSLMMTIMGFSDYKITNGKIYFEGQDITDLDITERSRLGIGIAMQRPPTIRGVNLENIFEYIIGKNIDEVEDLNYIMEEFSMKKFLNRNINDGLSGGEIKRSELLQLWASDSKFNMMDEPDSGVDLDSLRVVSKLINKIFSRDESYPVKRKSGLIITHNGNILKTVNADKVHVMMDGKIGCSGNPEIVINMIREHGYEKCIKCVKREV